MLLYQNGKSEISPLCPLCVGFVVIRIS